MIFRTDWEAVVTTDLEGAICDAEAARLLPWYVNGTLQAADVERVTSHLERCAICRGDFAHERALRDELKAPTGIEFAPQAGLERTLARIDELTREPPAVVASSAAQRRRVTPTQWLAAAVVVQAIGIGVLGAAVAGRGTPGAASYTTLSSATPVAAGPRIRAVFASAMPVADLRSLLATNGLSIVEGPSEAGVFTLAMRESGAGRARVDSLLVALRQNPAVEFAEPASDAGGAGGVGGR